MSGPSTAGITGYRNLTQLDKDSMNAVKALENTTGELVQAIRAIPGVDLALVNRAVQDLQVGYMLLVRSVAQPESALK